MLFNQNWVFSPIFAGEKLLVGGDGKTKWTLYHAPGKYSIRKLSSFTQPNSVLMAYMAKNIEFIQFTSVMHCPLPLPKKKTKKEPCELRKRNKKRAKIELCKKSPDSCRVHHFPFAQTPQFTAANQSESSKSKFTLSKSKHSSHV